MRKSDLFAAMWTPDLFMKRVEENAEWTLMCPKSNVQTFSMFTVRSLNTYTQYEKEGKGRKTIKARELWEKNLRVSN